MTPEGTLFLGSTVASGPDQTPATNQAIYVSGGVIREVGPADSVRAKYPAASVVDASGATILPGVSIGRDAVIAAGAVVADDVPPATLVTGEKATVRRSW